MCVSTPRFSASNQTIDILAHLSSKDMELDKSGETCGTVQSGKVKRLVVANWVDSNQQSNHAAEGALISHNSLLFL
jgi:RecG-like helicase